MLHSSMRLTEGCLVAAILAVGCSCTMDASKPPPPSSSGPGDTANESSSSVRLQILEQLDRALDAKAALGEDDQTVDEVALFDRYGAAGRSVIESLAALRPHAKGDEARQVELAIAVVALNGDLEQMTAALPDLRRAVDSWPAAEVAPWEKFLATECVALLECGQTGRPIVEGLQASRDTLRPLLDSPEPERPPDDPFLDKFLRLFRHNLHSSSSWIEAARLLYADQTVEAWRRLPPEDVARPLLMDEALAQYRLLVAEGDPKSQPRRRAIGALSMHEDGELFVPPIERAKP